MFGLGVGFRLDLSCRVEVQGLAGESGELNKENTQSSCLEAKQGTDGAYTVMCW